MTSRTRRPSIAIAALAIVGVLGWVWLGVIAVALGNAPTEPRTGFDLQLLVNAGRAVGAGRSPYDPSLVNGTAPVAVSLFYSYPPIVAQAMALLSWLPNTVILLAWDGLAVAGLAVVAAALGRRLAPQRSTTSIVVATLAIAPLCIPLAIGLLFGNLDVFFPLLYGVMLLGVLPAASRDAERGAGIALAVASLAKLHPASLGAWFGIRAVRGDRAARRAFVIAAAIGATALVVSVVVGGLHLWTDYLGVVRAGSGAGVIDPDNAGPAAQLAMALGRDDGFARAAQVAVTGVALLVTVVAARRGVDPVEGLAWAAAASLATLPVTWYHYPSALIPFGIAALLRADVGGRPIAVGLVAGALIVAAGGIALTGLIWIAVGLVLGAVHVTRPRPMTLDRIQPATAAARTQ